MKRSMVLAIGLGSLFWIVGEATQNLSARAKTADTREVSTPHARRLAKHLETIGARFYGSWTCPACHNQLDRFGDPATNRVPYVECNQPKQLPRQADSCRTAKLRVYPTWDAPGRPRLEGVQTLQALSEWSGLD